MITFAAITAGNLTMRRVLKTTRGRKYARAAISLRTAEIPPRTAARRDKAEGKNTVARSMAATKGDQEPPKH